MTKQQLLLLENHIESGASWFVGDNLAQPIRLLLNYVGQDFKDLKYEMGDGPEYSLEEWLSKKYTLGLEFPNLPYYIDEDVMIAQSIAIILYLGRKHGLVGKTDSEKTKVEMLLYLSMDISTKTWLAAQDPNYVTVADFPIYEDLDVLQTMDPDILMDFPKLKNFKAGIEALRAIKNYMMSDRFF